MKLERGKYPDFYHSGKEVIEEENLDLFVGREHDFQVFWDSLWFLKRRSRTNYAYLSQRKVGKTAFLRRCYNIMFSEQDEVVPLYYSFSDTESDIALLDACDDLAFTWAKQWAGFIYKNVEIAQIKMEKDFRKILTSEEYEEKDSSKKILRILNHYHANKKIKRKETVADEAMLVVNSLVTEFHMCCVLIIDEAQELARSIKDEDGEIVRCENGLSKVINEPPIWVLLSGSKVSMLHYQVVRGRIANRVFKADFDPLTENETGQLVRRCLENWNLEGYEGMEQDVYNLTKGIPFYVLALFNPSTKYYNKKGQEKSFRTQAELMEVYHFEVRNGSGAIYEFWAEHFQENAKLLNQDTPENPGLTYRILHYIAQKMPNLVHHEEIEEKFHLSAKEVEEKVWQLVQADFIRWKAHTVIQGITDPTFPLVLIEMRYKTILESPTEEKRDQAIAQMIATHLRGVKKDVDYLKREAKRVLDIEKSLRSVEGTMKVIQGDDMEERIYEAVRSGDGDFAPFKDYELDKIQCIRPGSKGKHHIEIDLFGCPEPKSSPNRLPLAVEIKCWKTKKFYLGDAKKVAKAIRIMKQAKKIKELVACVICTGPFSYNAKDYLKRRRIRLGHPKDFHLSI